MVARVVEIEQRPHPAFSTTTEQIIWQGYPSQWNNLGRYIFTLLFCWLVFPVLIAIIVFVRTRSIRYTLTNQRLKIESGLLGKDVEEVELYRVKDSTLRRTLVDKFKGTGTICLHTSDRSTPIVYLRGINDPGTLREKIRILVEARRDAKGIREVDYT